MFMTVSLLNGKSLVQAKNKVENDLLATLITGIFYFRQASFLKNRYNGNSRVIWYSIAQIIAYLPNTVRLNWMIFSDQGPGMTDLLLFRSIPGIINTLFEQLSMLYYGGPSSIELN